MNSKICKKCHTRNPEDYEKCYFCNHDFSEPVPYNRCLNCDKKFDIDKEECTECHSKYFHKVVPRENKIFICEYDTKGCKLLTWSHPFAVCKIHGKVRMYTREELEIAYQKGFFVRPELRNKKRKEPVRY